MTRAGFWSRSIPQLVFESRKKRKKKKIPSSEMRTLPLVAALVAVPAAGQLRFGPPQVVDNGIMPVDFLVFGGAGSARANIIVGREFNWLSSSNGESWTASHQGANYTSQIHRFPTQCRYCHNVSTVGGVINATSTSIKTKRSYTFTVQVCLKRLNCIASHAVCSTACFPNRQCFPPALSTAPSPTTLC